MSNLISVRFVADGPFAGRAYEVLPDGSTGRRRKDLEIQPEKAIKKDRKALERMVRGIPNQAVLDTILGQEKDALSRAAILEDWKPWLSFTLNEGENAAQEGR